MDAWVLFAVKVVFVLAVATPLVLIILYRCIDVPLRRADVEKMMERAFPGDDEKTSREAREALDNNPYISDPQKTFDRYHNPWLYVAPVLVLTALTAAFSYIVYSSVRYHLAVHATAITAGGGSPANAPPPAPGTPVAPSAAAQKIPDTAPASGWVPAPFVIIMALTGGYIWSLYQICARSRSSELSPYDLYEIDLGLFAAVPVGIAFSLITEQLDGVRSFAAFAASAFPLRDVQRLFRQYATRKTLAADSANSTPRPAELHLGNSIEGLSDQTLVRLGELRISTVLDMAYCDPIKVMVQTGFPLPVIIDWIDQSLWALYAGDLKSKINKRGIRCSLDVCEFVDLHLRDKDGQKKTPTGGPDQAALEALARAMDCEPVLLLDLMFRVDVDPQVALLRKLWYPHGVPKDLQASGT